MDVGIKKDDSRNVGIDLLRPVSMFFVVVLHALGHGGLLDGSPAGSAAYRAAWGLEAFAFCAVDIFALISGYVSYRGERRPTRFSSYLALWLEVVFYGLVINAAFLLIKPSSVSLMRAAAVCAPVMTNRYWYFTAYTGLIIIKPVLDAGLGRISQRTAIKVFIAVFAVFSALNNVIDAFSLGKGYSFAWIALLYVMGATMKKCDIGAGVKPVFAAVGIIALWLVTWAWKLFWKTDFLPGGYVDDRLFVSYVSPTVLGMAVLFVILFSKLRPGRFARKAARFAAPGAFAVYVINEHWLIRTEIMKGNFAFLAQKPVPVMLAAVVGFAAAFVLASLAVDKLRQLLFRAARVDRAAEWVDRRLDIAVEKLTGKS